MTRSPEDLARIVMSGRIEARGSYGTGRGSGPNPNSRRVVCLSEMPLAELGRMAPQDRKYGLAFPVDMVRSSGGQPVWYLDVTSVQHAAVEKIMSDLSHTNDWEHPFWDLTLFIESVRSKPGPGEGWKDFRWEREWRVQGDLVFDLADVVTFIDFDNGGLSFLDAEKFELGVPVYHPQLDRYGWTGRSLPSFSAGAAALVRGFRTEFITPDEANLYPDSEEGGYVWSVREYETEDALRHLFGAMPDEVLRVLADSLNQESTSWALAEDLVDPHE